MLNSASTSAIRAEVPSGPDAEIVAENNSMCCYLWIFGYWKDEVFQIHAIQAEHFTSRGIQNTQRVRKS